VRDAMRCDASVVYRLSSVIHRLSSRTHPRTKTIDDDGVILDAFRASVEEYAVGRVCVVKLLDG